jgi:HD-like signal output (HDOD) protein
MGQISSIQHASVILGHKTVGDLITMAATSGLLGSTLEGYGLDAGELWLHSMGVAFGSRIIANKKNPALVNDSFAAGLIHDAGKLVLDKYIFERKEAFQEFMKDGQRSFLIAEKEILGFDHAEIAFDICENWRVPQILTVPIKNHHYPSESERNELTYIVHMADMIAMMIGIGGGIDGMLYKMDDEAMEFLGFEEEDVDETMHEVLESVEKISEQMHET